MPTNEPTVPEMEPDWDSILEQLGLPPEPPAEPASSSGPTVTEATKPAPSATKSTPTEPTEPDSFAAGLLADEPAQLPPPAPPEPDGHSTSAKTTLAGTVGLTGPGSGGFAPPSAARREHASPALTGASVPFGGGLDEESPLPVADPALAEPSKVLIVSDEEVASFAWSEPISNEPDTDLPPPPAVADDLPAEPEPLQPSEPSEPSELAALAGPVADADSELEPEPGEDGAEDSVTESEAATESEPTAAGTEPPKGKRRRRRRRSRKKKAAQQSATVATEPAEASAPDAVDPQAATATPAPAAAEAEPLPLGSAAAPGQPAVTPTEKPSGRGKQRRSKGQRSSAEPQQPSAKSTELDETQDQPSPARNQTFLAGEDTSKYSEELLQTLRNWNVPSWSELIAGLYRPER